MRRGADVCDDAPAIGDEDVSAVAAPKTENGAPQGETRARILEAARQCLQQEGIAKVSARAIARHGDLNQALIFYHFGSVDGLLQATAREDSQLRADLYANRLADVTTLAELVAVGRAIHREEEQHGSAAVLTQLLAGTVSSPELRDGILAGMTPWTDQIEQALGRVLADTPLASAVPLADVAFAIASLFLGIELIAGLDPDQGRVESLFTSLDGISLLVDALLRSGKP